MHLERKIILQHDGLFSIDGEKGELKIVCA